MQPIDSVEARSEATARPGVEPAAASQRADIDLTQTATESKGSSSRLPYFALGALLLAGLVGLLLTQLGSGGEVAQTPAVVGQTSAESASAPAAAEPEPEPEPAATEAPQVVEDTDANAAAAADTADASDDDASAAAAEDADATAAVDEDSTEDSAAIEEDDTDDTNADGESAIAVDDSDESAAPDATPVSQTNEDSGDDENAVATIGDSTLSEQLTANEATYRGGKLYLSGPIQSQERIDFIVGLARPLLGDENIINEYYVDPTQTTQNNGAVRIDEPLLFTSGSTALNPELQEVLDLGVLVLQVFPQVTMQAVGHTDDIGPAAANQALSEARAQSVVEYMVSKGVPADRIVAFGLGDTEPIADNTTEEGRAKNRRIDVALLDLLAEAPSQ